MAPYQIFTDAAADCSPQWFASLPPIGVIPVQVGIGSQECTYAPEQSPLNIFTTSKRRVIMLPPRKSHPVSYTHLDVYKRQVSTHWQWAYPLPF